MLYCALTIHFFINTGVWFDFFFLGGTESEFELIFLWIYCQNSGLLRTHCTVNKLRLFSHLILFIASFQSLLVLLFFFSFFLTFNELKSYWKALAIPGKKSLVQKLERRLCHSTERISWLKKLYNVFKKTCLISFVTCP